MYERGKKGVERDYCLALSGRTGDISLRERSEQEPDEVLSEDI